MSSLYRRSKAPSYHNGSALGAGSPLATVQDRDAFFKTQLTAVSKALVPNEAPVKEKHIRRLILGTHTEQGAGTFWAGVTRIQLEGNRFLSWKFCYVFHKIVRGGHSNVLVDSMKYKTRISDLGTLWSHLRNDVYGPLIEEYTKLINFKLMFHQNNRSIPGDLKITDECLASLGEDDVNNWFELSVEMLDYLELILTLQNLVYNSMDMSRAHSQTSAGQCRLAPLIPCILDASCLYDYVVKMIFKLHAALPPDVLTGHRDRFYKQFDMLKKFYRTSSNLQYFKYLVQIPTLPDRPPNFLEASDFDSYIPMHAVMLADATSETGSDDTNSVVTLVDLGAGSSTQPSPPTDRQQLPEPDRNGWSKEAEVAQQREQLLATLTNELEELKQGAQRHRLEATARMEQYENRISQLMHENETLRESLDSCTDECERYREQAERLQNEQQAASNEDKFKKMKDVYAKLRSEHIDVLKRLGELQKDCEQLRVAKVDADEQVGRMDQESSKSAELVKNAQRSLENVFGACLRACAAVPRDAHTQLRDNPAHLSVTCSPEYVHTRVTPLVELLSQLSSTLSTTDMSQSQVNSLNSRGQCCTFCVDAAGRVGELVLAAAAMGRDVNVAANELNDLCGDMAEDFAELFESFADAGAPTPVSSTILAKCQAHLSKLSTETDKLMSKGQNRGVDEHMELGELVEMEMKQMDRAICAAVDKIQSMLDEARLRDTGIRLEVNSSILDACTGLMAAVRVLVNKARLLQQEIVEQGRSGSGSVKEFYKKNHKWTEGLLSAAKAVGAAAALLVQSADGSVSGSGKLEEVHAAAREVAAATAQLVVSSRVKAARDSDRMQQLAAASAGVTTCTAQLIGTVKSARNKVDETEATDFSSLTAHAAKQKEFALQVRVLELEADLARQRAKLGEIRRRNYCNDEDDDENGAA